MFEALKNSVVLIAACVPLLAQAEIGIYAKGGTMGLGGGIGYGISDNVTARIGYTAFNFDHDIDTSDVNYKGQFKIGGAEALLDWHPFNGAFRVTGGAVFNRNKVDVDAKLNQDVTINGVVYHASDVGKLGGTVDFNSTVPYLGIGWGNIAGRDGNFHFVADIGVLYQGSPDVKLHGSCSATFKANNAAACAQLDGNIHEEEKKLNDEVDDYKWWPVINIGVAYRF